MVAACAALAACDPQRIEKLEVGEATEVDVRKQFGDPVTWRFKPSGQESKLFSVTFDATGKVVRTGIADDSRETMSGTR